VVKSFTAFQCRDEEERLAHELFIKVVNDAIADRASAIHLVPQSQEYVMKYRIDGALREIARHTPSVPASLISIVKKAAALDPLSSIPQEGRLTLAHSETGQMGEAPQLRLSFFPTAFGEMMIIRILDPRKLESLKGKLDNICFNREEGELVRTILGKPFGMIIITGPAGSGKTTTYYAALEYLAERTEEQCSIISLECPIELQLDGVIQTAVDPAGGFTYARALKSLMQQDPDIIGCSEIQDLETARLLSNIAITGHLVLTLLHSADVAQAIMRLLQLGLEPYLLGMSIEGVIAQRLVRKICVHCSEEVTNSPEIVEQFCSEIEGYEKLAVTRHGRGCRKCDGTGFKGRTAVYEIFPGDRCLDSIILKSQSVEELRKVLRKKGYLSQRQKALQLAMEGVISLEEALRWTLV